MAIQYSCDFCGEPIEDGRLRIELEAHGHGHDPDRVSTGYVYRPHLGHYHATEEWPCWAEMVDRIRLIHAVSSDLGPDRDIVERRIEQRAERHRKRSKWEKETTEQRARVDAWRRLGQEGRDAVLLRALGEDRLTVRELTARINAELKAPPGRLATVYAGTVTKMVKRMAEAGQLERTLETFKNKPRYRYSRPRGLDGPIADLERSFNDDGEAVA